MLVGRIVRLADNLLGHVCVRFGCGGLLMVFVYVWILGVVHVQLLVGSSSR